MIVQTVSHREGDEQGEVASEAALLVPFSWCLILSDELRLLSKDLDGVGILVRA
jgi:hypothetical protein